MKTTLYYSTFITALITTYQCNTYQFDFEGSMDLEDCKRYALEGLEYSTLEIPACSISKITFIDKNTGEILMECEHDTKEEEEDFDDDWNYNEDMGFDPYEGDYTYDC